MNLLLRDIAEDYTVRLRTERTRIVGRATAGSQVSGSEDVAEAGALLLPQCTLQLWQETGHCAVLQEEQLSRCVLSLGTPLLRRECIAAGLTTITLHRVLGLHRPGDLRISKEA